MCAQDSSCEHANTACYSAYGGLSAEHFFRFDRIFHAPHPLLISKLFYPMNMNMFGLITSDAEA